MAEQIAETKRTRISKAQRLTLAEVLGASLILGVCIVVCNFLIKYINFNAKIITAKDDAINEYDATLRNVGICQDKDKNGRLNDAEIKDCNPNQTELEDVIGSLRYNILETMAANEQLESVARKRDKDGICYDESTNELIDYTELYNLAYTDAEKEKARTGMKLCSSLRVISDALPAQQNTEALMASLNALFIESDIEPDSIAPADDKITAEVENVGVIPVVFRMNGTGAQVISVLNNITRSIREFDVTSMIVEWTSKGISMKANANAFFLDTVYDPETEITVKAGRTGTATKGAGKSLSEANKEMQDFVNSAR